MLGRPARAAGPTRGARTGPITFGDLWAEAAARPGRPAIGLIHDCWAGMVGCAIQFDGETGAVVLDFPADRLFTAIRAHAGRNDWHILRQEAHAVGDRRHAMRYVMALTRKTPVRHA